MKLRRYHYEDVDGTHFPDSMVGDSLFYSIDFQCWLKNENDTIVSVTWAAQPGVVASDAYTEGYLAHVRLTPSTFGSFKIECRLTCAEGSVEQIRVVPMILKVF